MPPHRSTLDPKLDVVFSMLFGAERNRDLLLSLLNAVLEPAVPLVAVELLSERPERQEVDDKAIVLDLRVRLANGEQVDVEMQSQPRPAGRKRALYYWARLYAGGHQAGHDYSQLRRCVVIVITGFRMLESARFHSVFRSLEQTTGERLTDDYELHVLELPKLQVGIDGNEGQAALAWGKFLSAESDNELEALAMNDPALKRAKEALERLSADPEARRRAEHRETGLRLYHADLATVRDESEARGRVLGLVEAILALVSERGWSLSDAQRQRIVSCEDVSLLRRWLVRASQVQQTEEIFS
jgi:predicted transposase/invertase (TIGR01784 family)